MTNLDTSENQTRENKGGKEQRKVEMELEVDLKKEMKKDSFLKYTRVRPITSCRGVQNSNNHHKRSQENRLLIEEHLNHPESTESEESNQLDQGSIEEAQVATPTNRRVHWQHSSLFETTLAGNNQHPINMSNIAEAMRTTRHDLDMAGLVSLKKQQTNDQRLSCISRLELDDRKLSVRGSLLSQVKNRTVCNRGYSSINQTGNEISRGWSMENARRVVPQNLALYSVSQPSTHMTRHTLRSNHDTKISLQKKSYSRMLELLGNGDNNPLATPVNFDSDVVQSTRKARSRRVMKHSKSVTQPKMMQEDVSLLMDRKRGGSSPAPTHSTAATTQPPCPQQQLQQLLQALKPKSRHCNVMPKKQHRDQCVRDSSAMPFDHVSSEIDSNPCTTSLFIKAVVGGRHIAV